MNNYLWLLRREFWERRSIWLVPAAIAGILVLLTLFGNVHFMPLDLPMNARQKGAQYLVMIGALFFAVMTLTVSLYYLDCLYDDRRDRSVLFWKSLPISDTQTVLSKFAMGALVMPLVYYLIAEATVLLVSAIASLRWHEMSAILWQGDLWWQVQVLWLYLLVTGIVWYLPVIGWLLFVSAAVKRAPMLWSVLPLVVVYLVENFFIGRWYLSTVIGERLSGFLPMAIHGRGFTAAPDQSVWYLLNGREFFGSVSTWAGVAVGVALIYATIELRKRRADV